MSHLTIEKDIEYIKNQVNYLDTFQQKIFKALKVLKSGSSWKGLQSDEPIYADINRWLKSYSTLKNHLYQKEIIDEGVRQSLSGLPQLVFNKPLSTKDLLKQKGGFIKLLYAVLPPYRTSFNRKRVKEIESQLLEYKTWGEKLRKISYRIESVYTDGI